VESDLGIVTIGLDSRNGALRVRTWLCPGRRRSVAARLGARLGAAGVRGLDILLQAADLLASSEDGIPGRAICGRGCGSRVTKRAHLCCPESGWGQVPAGRLAERVPLGAWFVRGVLGGGRWLGG